MIIILWSGRLRSKRQLIKPHVMWTCVPYRTNLLCHILVCIHSNKQSKHPLKSFILLLLAVGSLCSFFAIMRVLELFLIISLPTFASSFYSKCQKYSIRCSDQCGGYGQHLKCLFAIPQKKHADNTNNKHKHEEAMPSAISLPHDQQHNWKQVVSTISVSRRRILL